jgi:hypothetical protein
VTFGKPAIYTTHTEGVTAGRDRQPHGASIYHGGFHWHDACSLIGARVMKPVVPTFLSLVLLVGNNTALADRNSHIGSVSYGYSGYN